MNRQTKKGILSTQSPRRKTRNQNNIQNVEHLLRMSSTRVGGPNDPPPIQRDVVVTKIIQLQPTVQNASFSLTYAAVAGGIPTCFDMLRIIKVSLWATATTGAKVSAIFSGDGAQFSDYGTTGAVRPQLHISPTFQTRQRWVASDSTDVIATVDVEPTSGAQLLIHVTAEFRSTASGT